MARLHAPVKPKQSRKKHVIPVLSPRLREIQDNTGSVTHSKLSNDDLIKLASLMKTAYGWDKNPKPFQLAGVQAQLEGNNIMIQAPTGAGKTAIAAGPHLWPSAGSRITIMISPLMALEDEMVSSQTSIVDIFLNNA